MFNAPSEAVKVVLEYLNSLNAGTTQCFGLSQHSDSYCATPASAHHPQVAAALSYTVRNLLMIEDACAVRAAHAVRRFGVWPGAISSIVVYWTLHDADDIRVIESPTASVQLADHIGTAWGKTEFLQILIGGSNGGRIEDAVKQTAAQALDHPQSREPEPADDPATDSDGEDSGEGQLSTIPEGSNEDGDEAL